MATERSNTELKVFLNGDYESQYSQLPDIYKEGSVFFDKTRRAVYAEGVLITSDVVDVKIEGSKLMVKKVGETTYTEIADLAIPDTFLQKTDVVNTLDSTLTDLPLSAAQGKELKRQIDEKVKAEEGKGLSTNDFTNGLKSKLDGIDDNAQTNREVTVNGNPIGLDADENQSTIKISGNLVTAPNNGEDSKIEFNLSHKYVANDKRIYFFNSATAPATGTTGAIFSIDTTDFVKDGMLANATYNESTHTLTLIFNTTATDSGVEDIEVDLSTLVDVYKAGAGLTLADNTFNFNYGAGLTIDESNQEVTVDVGNGLQIGTNRKITLKIADNGGITVNTNGAAVDWTKAPVQKVNDVTPDTNGNVKIDVTPKVWSF